MIITSIKATMEEFISQSVAHLHNFEIIALKIFD